MLSLSVLPLVALAVMLVAVVLARNWLTAVSLRTASVLGYVLAVPLVVAGLLGPDWVVYDLALGGGVAVGGVVTVSRVRSVDTPREALLYGAAVVACIAVLSIVVRQSITPVASMLSAVIPGALVASLYPVGVALGRERAVWQWWVLGVGLAIAAAILALMRSFVPFPGGPAYLLLPAVAILVVAVFLFGLPVLAVGAGSQDRETT